MTDSHIPIHDTCPYCGVEETVEEYGSIDTIEGTYDTSAGRVCIGDHDDRTYSVYVHTTPGE